MTQAQIIEIENLLASIYYDPSHSASYKGISPLLKEVNRILVESGRPKLPRQTVVDWAEKQDSYTSIKNSRIKFPTNPYKIPKLDSQAGSDMIDMRKFKKENDDFSWILVFMNLYSRFVWTEAVKSKDAKSVLNAIKKILARIPFKHQSLQTDRGGEYYNQHLLEFLKEQDIKLFSTGSSVFPVERFNRTFLARLFRYQTAKNTRRWVSVLQDLTDSYNNGFHTAISATPYEILNGLKEVKNVRTSKAYEAQFQKYVNQDRKYALPINQLVRLSYDPHHGNPFQKSYHSRWTDELFRVAEIIDKPGRRLLYKVKSIGEPAELIQNTFYANELSKVNEAFLSGSLHIDKILKYRGKGKKREALVTWKNYPKDYTTWQSVSTLFDI
jgi:Integrase core domain